MLDDAISIARRGFPVVLTHSIDPDTGTCTCGRTNCEQRQWGKHPIFARWPKLASVEEQALRDQFAGLSFMPNVGIALGPQPDGRYLICVDVDDAVRHEVLTQELGELPETATAKSPRGLHLLYVLPSDAPRELVKNITGIGGEPGVDMKAKGGQVVVLGRNAFGEYGGIVGDVIAELPPAWTLAILQKPVVPEALQAYTPATLREDARAKKRMQAWLSAAVISECSLLARTPEGARNTAVYKSAFKLFSVANGSNLPTAWGYVREELTRAARATGLKDAEINTILASAEKGVDEAGARRMPREVAPASLEATTGQMPAVVPSVDLIQDNGNPAKIAENVARMLAFYPGGVPRLSEFSGEIIWTNGQVLKDADVLSVQSWLFDRPNGERIKAGKDVVFDGITLAAEARVHHPVRDYLRGLKWDGVARIDQLFVHYFGAEDSEYIRAIGACFLVGAVARVMVPGEKVDTIPVLEGKQGRYKSTAIEELTGGRPWFGDTTLDLRSKDRFENLAGVWIYELSEVEEFTRDERSRLKAFVTSRSDKFRPSYGRLPIDRPRQNVFIGTTNEGEYLEDATGGRRFWPVRCGEIDVGGLRRDRDMLWAEATQRHAAGEQWWLSPKLAEEAEAIVERRRIIDPWEESVATFLMGRQRTTLSEVLVGIHVTPDRAGKAEGKRICAAMRRLGWASVLVRQDAAVSRVWVAPSVTPPQALQPIRSNGVSA